MALQTTAMVPQFSDGKSDAHYVCTGIGHMKGRDGDSYYFSPAITVVEGTAQRPINKAQTSTDPKTISVGAPKGQVPTTVGGVEIMDMDDATLAKYTRKLEQSISLQIAVLKYIRENTAPTAPVAAPIAPAPVAPVAANATPRGGSFGF